MTEKIYNINGIDICTESFGNPAHPPILLIMGAMCSMVYWDEEFCQRLADFGRYVIRYDNRDVGRSTCFEPGNLQYSVIDMAEDAAGVLDAYGIDQAHIVGMSLGGMIAQIAAISHPERVLSITLIASSMIGSDNNDRELPPIDEKILAYHSKGATLNWADEKEVADYLVAGARLLCGSKRTFDEKRVYKQVTNEISRANNLLSMFNHALLAGDDSFQGKVKEIDVPALVIHGTEDIVLPYEHAVALATEISHATLLPLEGTGHEIHFDDWDAILTAILNHTSIKGFRDATN